MTNKTLGFILAGVGLIVFLLSYPGIRALIGLTIIPANISDTYLMIAGIILVLIGAFLSFRKSGEEVKEVPIYKDEKIVGYRVLKEE